MSWSKALIFCRLLQSDSGYRVVAKEVAVQEGIDGSGLDPDQKEKKKMRIFKRESISLHLTSCVGTQNRFPALCPPLYVKDREDTT